MIDDVWTTVRQAKGKDCMSHSTYKTHGIRPYHQLHTNSLGHNECIKYGLTDGHILIECHGRQKETLSHYELIKKNKQTNMTEQHNQRKRWLFSSRKMSVNILGPMKEEEQTSTKDKWLRKKYMGVCSWGSIRINVIIPRFARRLIR